jgi:Fe-S cluster assembly iron-binding protein IscA
MIKITDAAKEKLQGTLERNPGKYLRIVMKGIG